MTRLEASRLVAATLTDEAVVASLGHPAYDLFASGDRPLNFYTWGSMGLACSIGLGLALAQPERRIIVLDGDGSLLMNLGALATITVAGASAHSQGLMYSYFGQAPFVRGKRQTKRSISSAFSSIWNRYAGSDAGLQLTTTPRRAMGGAPRWREETRFQARAR